MRVIVTGSRDWSHGPVVQAVLQDVILEHGPFTLVHGGCPRGADRFADRWARAAGIPVKIFEADWEKYGTRAGPIRNAEMIQAGADLVLAFPLPGGKGTQHTIRLAQEAGIPVKVWGSDV